MFVIFKSCKCAKMIISCNFSFLDKRSEDDTYKNVIENSSQTKVQLIFPSTWTYPIYNFQLAVKQRCSNNTM